MRTRRGSSRALRVGVCTAFALVLGAATAPASWDALGRAWWAHVEYLASDRLAGRNVGTPGFEMAAHYVAREFAAAGLRAAGGPGFFQPVEFTKLTLDESKSALALVRSGKTIPLKLGDDAVMGVWPDTAGLLQAPLVFVGYGLKIPEVNWDDLSGLPLRGAVAVYLRGGPASIPGNLRAHYSSTEGRWKALRAAGAQGMIGLANPKDMEVPWSRISASRLMPRMTLADPKMDATPGLRFSAAWNPAKAEELFAGTDYSFAGVLDAAGHNQALPHFAMRTEVRAKAAVSRAPMESENVIGLRSGADPVLAHQIVVISAHLDHLGSGAPVNGDGIYNGAMDDASGIASLIEIARAMQREHLQTKRSIVFLAMTGEEKGELGSKFFTADPTVEGRYVADIDMDILLPLFPLKYLEVQGLDESTLGGDIRSVCEEAGVVVQADKEPNQNSFIRSDQYSFIKHGVPALAFKFGWLPGTPQERIFQNWYQTRYHGVKDDTTQPVDKAAAARFDDILLKLAERVADQAQAPSWEPQSFFRRFAAAR